MSEVMFGVVPHDFSFARQESGVYEPAKIPVHIGRIAVKHSLALIGYQHK